MAVSASDAPVAGDAALAAAGGSAPEPASHPIPQLGLPVGSGSLLAVDADRIIIKKILLTGTPFRCSKRKAVVRWMFFEP